MLKLTAYIFKNHNGGEYIWFRRVAEKLGLTAIVFWDNESNKLLLRPSGMANRAVWLIIRLISGKNKERQQGLYSLLGTYTYRIPVDREPILMSSTYVPLPRSKNIIAYIHTPSRFLTIDFQDEIIRNSHRPLKIIYLRLWKLVYYFLYKSSMSRAAVIIANSVNTQQRLKKYMGLDSVVIHPSVDIEHFHCEKPDNYFFLPSRISPQKNQLLALKAFRIFQESRKDFKLVLASTILKSQENIRYLSSVREFISKNNLAVEIMIGLDRTDVIKLYSLSFACLFTGNDEDFGQVPVESMASSKPVIAIEEGGMTETIRDGVTGFLVSDEYQMAARMLELADNPEKAQKMGEKGRTIAESEFSDSVFIERFKKLVLDLGLAQA